MRRTRRERQFAWLLRLWALLFGVGFLVCTLAPLTEVGRSLYRSEPLLVFVWWGQGILFLATWYTLNGLRDNEHGAAVLWWYKVVSGLTMILMLLSAGEHLGPWGQAFGGGLLDFGMGAATLWLWLRARRSRYRRLPLEEMAEREVVEEPDGRAARRHRTAIIALTGVHGVGSLGLLITLMALDVTKTATFMIAAGNAVGTTALIAFAGMMASETARRRGHDLDMLVLGSALGVVGLSLYCVLFRPDTTVLVAYLVAAGVLLVGIVWTVGVGLHSLRAQRRPAFLHPFLHQVLESFADVLIQGDEEVLSPRQVTDRADRWLAGVGSSRTKSIALAIFATEMAPLTKGRLPMSRMGRAERADFFRTAFRYGMLHDLVRLRSLLMLVYYSSDEGQAQIGFEEVEARTGRFPQPPVPRIDPAFPEPPEGDELAFDVCVLGSGAGGAVVAQRLAARGKSVIVVEEGPHMRADGTRPDPLTVQQQAYRDGGMLTTSNFDLSLLQGRCVGGSSYLNNGIVFELPQRVLHDWRRLGCCIDRRELEKAYAAVRGDIGSLDLAQRPGFREAGAPHFVQGCRRLGESAHWFEANLGDCVACGGCTEGCYLGRKQSVDRSLLPSFAAHGGVLMAETRAVEIEHDGRRARAVRCVRKDGSEVRIRARQVAVACGTVHSSLLLQHSGIERNVGTRVSFNVGSWVFAEFPEEIRSYDGVQMCAYHDDNRYFLETLAMRPGVFAASMPGWFEDHFDNMLRYRHFAAAGALVGTRPVGRIEPPRVPFLRDVLSPIHFDLPYTDLRDLRKGVEKTCRIWLAAGATRVMPATSSGASFTHPNQVDRLEEIVVEAEDLSFGSAHPQGGNPMSDDPEIGAVDTSFRVHGFDNLFVADASVFPTSVGVNPQLGVMALAHIAAERMADHEQL